MRKFFFIFILFLTQIISLKSDEFKINQILFGLDSPWSMTFLNKYGAFNHFFRLKR